MVRAKGTIAAGSVISPDYVTIHGRRVGQDFRVLSMISNTCNILLMQSALKHISCLRRVSPLSEQRTSPHLLDTHGANLRHPGPTKLSSLSPRHCHLNQHSRHHRLSSRPLLRHLPALGRQLHRLCVPLQHLLAPLRAHKPTPHHSPRSQRSKSTRTCLLPPAAAIPRRYRRGLGDYQRNAARAREKRIKASNAHHDVRRVG